MPTTEAPGQARQALLKAIDQFNSWRFYDCHETLEDVWLETGPKGDDATLANFYQGLIKAAAGFHHVLRDNHKGATTLLTDSLRLLDPYRPATLGVDIATLTTEVQTCLDRLTELGPDHLPDFDRSTIPTIEFDPNALK